MDRILCILIGMIAAASRCSRSLSELGIGKFEEWHPGEKLKILIVGYNGAGNTGADARVAASVKQIKELYGADSVSLSVITLDEEAVACYFDEDVRMLKISSIFLRDLYRACSSHHAAVICEGSTLKSTFANALSLFFCEAAGIMSAQKKPCIAFGSEAGRMDGFLKRFAGRMCKDTYFITRTRESMDVLNASGLRGHIGTDTVWLYDDEISESEAEELLKSQGWDGESPLLGAAVIDPFCWPVRPSLLRWAKAAVTKDRSEQYDKWYFFSSSPERKAAYEKYISEMAKAVASFARDEGCFPVLIGMEKMDAGPCRDLMEKIGMPCAVFLSKDRRADVIAGVLKKLSVLVTSRYHAAVLSMKGGCPIIAVSMDERLDSLMRELSLDDGFLCHVTDEDLDRLVYDSLSEGYRQRKKIGEHILARRSAYREKQKEMGVFLKEYLDEQLRRQF